MTLHDAAVRLLRGWEAPDDAQERLRTGYLAHLAASPDAVRKAGPPAHLTASAFVVDPDRRRVLLVHHRKGGFWVQPGGHLEPGDADLGSAALREAREETGLADVRLVRAQPADLDRHALPAAFGRCREHLDVAFLAEASGEPVVSDESDDVRWFAVDALPPGVVADLPPRLARALRRLAPATAAPSPGGPSPAGQSTGGVPAS